MMLREELFGTPSLAEEWSEPIGEIPEPERPEGPYADLAYGHMLRGREQAQQTDYGRAAGGVVDLAVDPLNIPIGMAARGATTGFARRGARVKHLDVIPESDVARTLDIVKRDPSVLDDLAEIRRATREEMARPKEWPDPNVGLEQERRMSEAGNPAVGRRSSDVAERVVARTHPWQSRASLTGPTSPLRTKQYAAISAPNPEELFTALREAGFEPIPVRGNYGGVDEQSFLVPGMSDQQALEFGRRFKQESVLTPRGLLYSEGHLNPVSPGQIRFGDELAENFSEIDTPEGPVRFQLPIDFEQRVPLGQMADLEHYSTTGGLTKLDPGMHGTGFKGAERKRKAQKPETFLPRSYAYRKGTKPEQGVGQRPYIYEGQTPEYQLYDLSKDPHGFKEIAEDANHFEQLVKDAGYRGYHDPGSEQLPGVVALFDELEVKPRPTRLDEIEQAAEKGLFDPNKLQGGFPFEDVMKLATLGATKSIRKAQTGFSKGLERLLRTGYGDIESEIGSGLFRGIQPLEPKILERMRPLVEKIQTPDLPSLSQMQDMVASGQEGKLFYHQSGTPVLAEHTTPGLADAVADMQSVFSQQASPEQADKFTQGFLRRALPRSGGGEVPLERMGEVARREKIGIYGQQADKVVNLIQQGGLPPGPKVSRFRKGLSGDEFPVVIDRQIKRLMGIAPDAKLSPAQYEVYERIWQELARDLGEFPMQTQAAGWLGFKKTRPSFESYGGEPIGEFTRRYRDDPELADLLDFSAEREAMEGTNPLTGKSGFTSQFGEQTQEGFHGFLRRGPSESAAKVAEYAPMKQSTRSLRPAVVEARSTKKSSGTSKVVDEAGRPRTVYHGGMRADDPQFRRRYRKGDWGDSELGTFFSEDSDVAARFVDGDKSQVVSAELQITNPHTIHPGEYFDMLNKWSAKDFRALKRSLMQKGHDGIYVPADLEIGSRQGWVQFKSGTWIAFGPEQIRPTKGGKK